MSEVLARRRLVTDTDFEFEPQGHSHDTAMLLAQANTHLYQTLPDQGGFSASGSDAFAERRRGAARDTRDGTSPPPAGKVWKYSIRDEGSGDQHMDAEGEEDGVDDDDDGEEDANPVLEAFTVQCVACQAPLKPQWERCPICKGSQTSKLTQVFFVLAREVADLACLAILRCLVAMSE